MLDILPFQVLHGQVDSVANEGHGEVDAGEPEPAVITVGVVLPCHVDIKTNITDIQEDKKEGKESINHPASCINPV